MLWHTVHFHKLYCLLTSRDQGANIDRVGTRTGVETEFWEERGVGGGGGGRRGGSGKGV